MNVQLTRRPTMRDVASRAGVSLKTVSRVINVEDGVRQELVDRVEAAVRDLRYQPDERARNLRSTDSRTMSIGFVMVDVANPFFSSIFRGLEEVAREHDCLVLAGSSDGDQMREAQLLNAFISRRVDGLVVVPSGGSLAYLKPEIDHGTPVVFVDIEPLEYPEADLVRSDHHGGAAEITRHLIAAGHADVAFLGDDPSIFSAGLRLAGFRSAMAEAGLDVHDEWIVTGHHRPSDWFHIVRDFFSRTDRPTAVVTAQNFVTVGAVAALHELGLHREIAMIGFDDIELAAALEPGISVVPQQPRELGRRAGAVLFERLREPRSASIKDILASPIIARGSGEIAPPAHLKQRTKRGGRSD